MKRSRSSYEALSPRSSEDHQQHHTTEQYNDSNSPNDFYTDLFGDAPTCVGNLDPLQQYLDSYNGHQEQTNTPNQSGLSRTCVDTEGSHLQTQQIFERTQQREPRRDDGGLRGATNHAEHPSSISASRETRSAQQHFPSNTAASSYITSYTPCSVTRQRSAVTPMQNPPTASTEFREIRSTLYGPYCSLFLSSDAARDHRHLSTRFGRQPYISPKEDPTIIEIENDRQYQVGRIYDAMTRGDRAQDNTNSIAMKRWVNGAHYKSDLVESFAHKVFDCLLVQVTEGFRGWHHNDYVDDDRKGEKEDREADCMSRLENIIDALEREKTICEDVVNSASQIRMFVNAPIAYAARKYQNRVGNSKRGRTKDVTDLNPRPTKARRTGTRQIRDRSITTSEVPTSRDSTPQFQTTAAPARHYYTTQSSQKVASSPTSTYLAPRQPTYRSAASIPQVCAGRQQAIVMSSPTLSKPATSSSAMSPPVRPASHSYNAHITTNPPAQSSPLASTPSLSYSYHSAPPSPDDLKFSVSTNSPATWSSINNPLCTPVDPSLTSPDLPFSHQIWPDSAPSINTTSTPTSFAPHPHIHHVSLADLEHQPLQPVTATSIHHPDFESYWNEQPGVQPFSFAGDPEVDREYH